MLAIHQMRSSWKIVVRELDNVVNMMVSLHCPTKDMSMESQTDLAPRRIPIQERGEKRVAGLLEAAAAIFAEVGFEAATMRDIAERAGASIGSLYQFFPNKEVVAQAIKTR